MTQVLLKFLIIKEKYNNFSLLFFNFYKFNTITEAM
jgi:hypothetical protein